MASATAFDGHYAIAQIWKLDTSPLFKGRYFQLSSMLAEYLMPVLLPGRFKLWAEKYGRLADVAVGFEARIHLLDHEGIPPQLSSRARVSCKAWRMEGNTPVRIYYSGTVEQYLTQREEVFGTAVPYSLQIEDVLTAEEVALFEAFDDHYDRMWPWIDAVKGENGRLVRIPHPQLRDLYENRRTFLIQWDLLNMRQPTIEDLDYIRRTYVDGELDSEVATMRLLAADPDSDSTDEWDWD